MTRTAFPNPFHEGERAAQQRAGVGDIAARVGGFIRDSLPEQHRAFHASLPFLIAAGADAAGRTWVTLIEGPDGFASSPGATHMMLGTTLAPDDPLAGAFSDGTEIGVLGIQLHTRRRNRFNGHIRKQENGYAIGIRQTFGNCPKYIHQRSVTREKTTPGEANHAAALSDDQIARIRAADTMFIGSGYCAAGGVGRGFDASHRGGAAGFVQVADARHLQIPDYAGNNYFNTIGNLISDARMGLLFIDFGTGGLLHLTGRASIDWSPESAQDPAALRMIEFAIDAVIDRPGAVALRWSKQTV